MAKHAYGSDGGSMKKKGGKGKKKVNNPDSYAAMSGSSPCAADFSGNKTSST